MKANLCKCNKCDAVLIDQNPQIGAAEYDLEEGGYATGVGEVDEMQYLKDNGGDMFWACPNCETDEYLIDL